MNNLPNEVLYQVFTHLPQKYAIIVCSLVCKKWSLIISHPYFYSTIHVYSKWDMGKYIQLVNRGKKIKGELFSNHAKRIVFHYMPHIKPNIKFIAKFSNIRSIEGLRNNYSFATSIECQRVYFRLHQLTDLSYCNHNEEWIMKFNSIKNNLKSLKIYITHNLLHYNPKNEGQEQNDPIQFKTMGTKRINIGDTEPVSVNTISIKMLQLSSTAILVNLTKLSINFKYPLDEEYIINEYTFENIHQTCPSLESLTLEGFNMDIIDYDNDVNEYDAVYNKHPNNPARRLKTLNIILSKYGDPCCFSYFGEKYPNLETLSFDIWFQDIKLEYVPVFQEAIINMLLQFPLLKRVSLLPKTYNGYHNWLHILFVTWLNQHPIYLTHFDYIYDSVFDISLRENKIISGFSQEETLQLQLFIKQPKLNLFNHLTSLSVTINNAVQYALTYLLANKNATTVSNVLEKLTIEGYLHTGTRITYFYDWLIIFPKLVSLAFRNFEILGDIGFINEHNIRSSSNSYLNGEDYHNVFNLHRIIEYRKQQQLQNMNINQRPNKMTACFKLKSLEIWRCQYWHHRGLNDFFKQCRQLEVLKFEHSTLIDPLCAKGDDIEIDLSHLYLEFLYINELSYVAEYRNFIRCLNNLYIHLSATGGKIFRRNIPTTYINDNNFDLHIRCKYIDGVVLNEVL
ncbi:unnamed protein product [Cunninghamella blakesleeana]